MGKLILVGVVVLAATIFPNHLTDGEEEAKWCFYHEYQNMDTYRAMTSKAPFSNVYIELFGNKVRVHLPCKEYSPLPHR